MAHHRRSLIIHEVSNGMENKVPSLRADVKDRELHIETCSYNTRLALQIRDNAEQALATIGIYFKNRLKIVRYENRAARPAVARTKE